jgi:hypothetical protein
MCPNHNNAAAAACEWRHNMWSARQTGQPVRMRVGQAACGTLAVYKLSRANGFKTPAYPNTSSTPTHKLPGMQTRIGRAQANIHATQTCMAAYPGSCSGYCLCGHTRTRVCANQENIPRHRAHAHLTAGEGGTQVSSLPTGPWMQGALCASIHLNTDHSCMSMCMSK